MKDHWVNLFLLQSEENPPEPIFVTVLLKEKCNDVLGVEFDKAVKDDKAIVTTPSLTELIEEEIMDEIERKSPVENLPLDDNTDDAGPTPSTSIHLNTPPARKCIMLGVWQTKLKGVSFAQVIRICM